jgi:hypothetical protein
MQEGSDSHSIGSGEKLINPQTGEEVGGDRRAILLLHRIQSVVDIIGRGPIDSFAGSSAKAVV